MKRIFRLFFLLLLLAALFVGWRFLAPDTAFGENKKSFYIKDNSSLKEVVLALDSQAILKNPESFAWLAGKIDYDKNIHPGRYVISKGSSIYQVLRLLKSGKQTPVHFIITKLRTKEDLAAKIGASFECDSTAFIQLLNNNDSLVLYGLDTNTAMTAIIPNTYDIYWNTPPARIFRKLYNEQQKFWNEERTQKAAALGLSTRQVYTLASIVDEETTAAQDRGPVASVYLNRMRIGMRLEADPTIKFALRNFALKRIYKGYIDSTASSPYNTYTNKGLPPGPICTPSPKTIDAVLNAPVTDYLYFVAKPDFSGLSNFTGSYMQHLINKNNYIQFLNGKNIK